MKKNTLLLAIFAFVGLAANAQRSTNAKDADYSFLKKEKTMNIKFDYDGMTVGKNQTEKDYVAATIAEKNEKKPGAGDKWLESWEKGKINTYEPTFKTIFNKKMTKLGITIVEGDGAHLTLIVKTTRIEPGFNAGVLKMAAAIDLEYIFVETANPNNIIAQVVMSKVPGSDTYAVSDRVNLAYSVASRKLAGYISKQIK